MKSLEEEETKTGHGVDETGKGTSRTFGTASTRKGRKQEERRRIMSSLSTDNDVTALEFGCCTRKNKKKRRRAVATGLALQLADQRRALNEPRNLTSTTATPKKRYLKSHKQIEMRTTIKDGLKTLQMSKGKERKNKIRCAGNPSPAPKVVPSTTTVMPPHTPKLPFPRRTLHLPARNHRHGVPMTPELQLLQNVTLQGCPPRWNFIAVRYMYEVSGRFFDPLR
jgi:hypothetical protein